MIAFSVIAYWRVNRTLDNPVRIEPFKISFTNFVLPVVGQII